MSCAMRRKTVRCRGSGTTRFTVGGTGIHTVRNDVESMVAARTRYPQGS